MAMDWGVELLRLSLISPGSLSIADSDWEAITGEKEAETRQLVQGGRRYVGKFAGGSLLLQAVGNRLDVILSPLPESNPQDFRVLVIGDWKVVREAFVQATTRWLDASPITANRIAFGAVLLAEAKTVREGYELLKTLLSSVTVDPNSMRDLQFRVNWRADSATLPGLPLNRITFWSVPQLTRMLLQVTGSDVTKTGSPAVQSVRLEMDHNTADEHTDVFDHKYLVPIYRELVDMACENAAEGERP